jgi:methenyltetrahydromethanopterin cyclohydrolase
MKTAMQELIFHIAYMERRKYQDEQTQILGGMNDCIMYDAMVIQNRVIEELTKEYSEYLEKEKEQIRNAYNDGYFAAYKYKDWEEYYKQNFNQNK